MIKVVKLTALVLCFFLFVGCSNIDILDNSSEILDSFETLIFEIKDNQARDIALENTDFETKNNTCYKKLNERQKEIYRVIYAISEQMPKGFINIGEKDNNTINDIHVAYTAFLNDNVEVFWMPYRYLTAMSKKEQVSIAFSYSGDGSSVDYIVSKSQREKMKKLLKSMVDNILSGAEKLNGAYEKEKYFNDKICSKVTYTEEGNLVHTAYGALVNGSALCEGYARAFKLLCNNAGIECELVTGQADGAGHMWNVVCIDGEYSYVDTTWNDDEEEMNYLYFNISEQQLETNHIIAPVIDEIPLKFADSDIVFNFVNYNCDGISNTYFARNNLVLDKDYAQKASKRISELYSLGNEKISFLITNSEFLNALQNDDLSYITDIQKQLRKIRIDSYSLNRDVLTLFVCER